MVEIKYRDGYAVRIEFGEKEHSYNVSHQFEDGTWTGFTPTHGVTTPLTKTVDKPFLAPWIAKMTAQEAVQAMADYDLDAQKAEEFIKDLFDLENETLDARGRKVMTQYRFRGKYPWFTEIKQAYKNASAAGKEAGTWLHKAVEEYHLSGRKTVPTLTPETEGMWNSFIKFDNLHKPKVEESEFIVYSRIYNYSGMGDVKGTMNGKTFIGDYKTTNRSEFSKMGISYDNFYQLGGLAQAEFERTGEWPDDVCIINIDKGGEDPIVVWGSDWGMSPEELARRYIAHLVAYKCQVADEYKFKGAF